MPRFIVGYGENNSNSIHNCWNSHYTSLFVTTSLRSSPPSDSVFFNFHGSAGTITMSGGGQWVKGAPMLIDATGGFRDTTGAQGNWHSIFFYTSGMPLTSCGSCDAGAVATIPTNVAFRAEFNAQRPAISFEADVVVNDGSLDISSGGGSDNFWVEGFGFGTANSHFKDRPNPPP